MKHQPVYEVKRLSQALCWPLALIGCLSYLRSWYSCPSGSVLGPLLFIIYVNEQLLSIKHASKVILFADDAGLLVTDKNYEQFKQKAYSAMSWLGEWFDKTNYF